MIEIAYLKLAILSKLLVQKSPQKFLSVDWLGIVYPVWDVSAIRMFIGLVDGEPQIVQ